VRCVNWVEDTMIFEYFEEGNHQKESFVRLEFKRRELGLERFPKLSRETRNCHDIPIIPRHWKKYTSPILRGKSGHIIVNLYKKVPVVNPSKPPISFPAGTENSCS